MEPDVEVDEDQNSVYDAEHRWASKNSVYGVALTKKEATQITTKLCRKFNKPAPQVVFTNTMYGVSYYERQDQMIVLSGGWGQRVHVLLHELAHHVSTGDGHDQNYRDTMIKIVGAHFGSNDAQQLRREYERNSLAVAAKRLGKP